MATVALRLIGTTDMHAHVGPYDYYRDAPDEKTGLAKAATLIAAARAEIPNSLTFDNGDLIQGSPLGDWAAEALASGALKTHPMIPAMNAVGYDAATVGNHEFNYGLDILAKALEGAAFPFLCCNVLRIVSDPQTPADDRLLPLRKNAAEGRMRGRPNPTPLFPPWTILTKTVRDTEGASHDLKIGVIGFVTPDIVRWDMSHLAGRTATVPIVEAARQHVPACRAAGADVIVALCHAGISKIGPAGAGENAALALAESGGLDALFIGHQHLLLPGPDFAGVPGVDTDGKLAGVPAVMAGFWAGCIGLIDLTLEREPAGWRVAASRSQLRAVEPATLPSLAVLAVTASAHEATLAYIRAPVGELEAPLASYYAMLGDDPSVRIIHDAQLWYVRRLMDSIPALREAPLLSASAPFKCGGRNGADYYAQVPAGPIALRHVADLYVYPNGLRVVRATGAMVREWLERSASVFETLNPRETAPQPLLAPAFAAYDFDQIDGIAYRLDLTQPPRYDDQGRLINPQAHRVTGLDFADDAPFLIVTNSYRANGGGHFPGCDGSRIVYEAPDSNFDALLQYVRSQKRVRPSPGGLWRLAPWPANVTALLKAPPAAAGFPTPPGVKATPLGADPDGFTSFRITTQL